MDAIQNITGDMRSRGFVSGSAGSIYAASGAFISNIYSGPHSPYKAALTQASTPTDVLSFDASRVARTATETRGPNTAYHPRIHA